MSVNFCMLAASDGSGEVAINPASVAAVKRLAGKQESQVYFAGGHVTVIGVVEEIVLKLLRVEEIGPVATQLASAPALRM